MEYIHFNWLQWIWYREPVQFPEQNLCLGRWLGVAHDVGQAMTYWVLVDKGTVIARSSVTALGALEMHDPRLKEQQDVFMAKLATFTPSFSDSLSPQIFPELVDDEPEYTNLEVDDFTPEAFDE